MRKYLDPSRIPPTTAFALVSRPPGEVRDGWEGTLRQRKENAELHSAPQHRCGKPEPHKTLKQGGWGGEKNPDSQSAHHK